MAAERDDPYLLPRRRNPWWFIPLVIFAFLACALVFPRLAGPYFDSVVDAQDSLIAEAEGLIESVIDLEGCEPSLESVHSCDPGIGEIEDLGRAVD